MNAPLHTRSPDLAWRELHEHATAPYKASGSFGGHFARGKLGHDPAFRGIVSRGLVGAERPRMLDIGSGQSLFANVLHTAAQLQRDGRWPAEWPPLPAPARYTGIELMPRDVARARAALTQLGEQAQFVCGDMRHTEFPSVDAVVILDVLHYITVAEQDQVLARVRAALPAGGLLLLRVGDAAARRGFAVSQWVDAVVTRIRGHRVLPQYGRTLAEWSAQLQKLGFTVQSRPMSAGTPFANVLLIAKVTT